MIVNNNCMRKRLKTLECRLLKHLVLCQLNDRDCCWHKCKCMRVCTWVGGHTRFAFLLWHNFFFPLFSFVLTSVVPMITCVHCARQVWVCLPCTFALFPLVLWQQRISLVVHFIYRFIKLWTFLETSVFVYIGSCTYFSHSSVLPSLIIYKNPLCGCDDKHLTDVCAVWVFEHVFFSLCPLWWLHNACRILR